MYNEAMTFHKTMGDVDVLWHDGVYHLFHLVLPNHDFIAHAVSRDGFNWRRVDNALFIGHPGGWDDHMLWTVHVSADPHRPGSWRMFYTGLSRQESGEIQRVGLARSDDLLVWRKAGDCWPTNDEKSHDGSEGVASAFEPGSPFPLVAAAPYYEHSLEEGRGWVSWRDPFYFRDNDKGYLLTAARVPDGPVIRRGCVGLMEETRPERFELLPPLHQPGQYDDIEVPNLLKIGRYYYLIGSIREDAKVRYWYSESLKGPWRNFSDNVLLPQGNYAARVSWDDAGPLLWNFYTADSRQRDRENLMPPPKRLIPSGDGQLRVVAFEGIEQRVERVDLPATLLPLQPLVHNRHASWSCENPRDWVTIESQGGFECFLLNQQVESFRFSAILELEGSGKCGLIFRIDPVTSNGYYLSLDLLKGVVQLRSWGEQPGGKGEHSFQFRTLQAGFWRGSSGGPWEISLVALRDYLEFSIEGHVLLTLADATFQSGRMGCYVETARLRITNPTLEHLRAIQDTTRELANG